MKKNQVEKNKKLFEDLVKQYRDPREIFLQYSKPKQLENLQHSLKFHADSGFKNLLKKLEITLFITREYEHLILALTKSNNYRGIEQTYFSLPHPSGLVIDKKSNAMYVAATRNPNQIWEFLPASELKERDDYKSESLPNISGLYMPARSKILAGSYYIHDLAIINNKLFANSVGQNAIINVNLNNPQSDKITWKPNTLIDCKLNHLQLNSIAPGKSIEESYFSASTPIPTKYKPGDKRFRVDKRGVIFSGNKDVVAAGLTRPHSARVYKNKIWVDNSGYGEFGYIEKEKFVPTVKLSGWTRGLSFYKNYAFVGVSKILPRFTNYAPGLIPDKSKCYVAAIDMNLNKIVGKLSFPNGNQIFAIDWQLRKISKGFVFSEKNAHKNYLRDVFYGYKI